MSGSDTSLVDVHAHFLTEDYAAAAIAAGHRNPDGMPGWPSWSARDHLTLMDTHGIATSMLSISSPGVHFGDGGGARALARSVNDAGAAVRDAHPDRFGHFASLPLPDVDGALDELRRALDDLGSDGVIILTNSLGTYLGDRSYEPLYAELDRRGTAVFVHPTTPPGAEAVFLGRPRPMLEFFFDAARAVSDLLFTGALSRYPGIRWIVTHSGGALPVLADRMELFRARLAPGESRTVAEQLGGLHFDMAGTPFPRQVPALLTLVAADRLLYGSDFCWSPAASVAAQIASLDGAEPPPGDQWRDLTSRNAARLFPRLLGDGAVAGRPVPPPENPRNPS